MKDQRHDESLSGGGNLLTSWPQYHSSWRHLRLSFLTSWCTYYCRRRKTGMLHFFSLASSLRLCFFLPSFLPSFLRRWIHVRPLRRSSRQRIHKRGIGKNLYVIQFLPSTDRCKLPSFLGAALSWGIKGKEGKNTPDILLKGQELVFEG
jgi:hypothetical protein